jgi:hypothetical protein
MYFGLQDTKPPPCPLHLTEQGGKKISNSNFYCFFNTILTILIGYACIVHNITIDI